MDSADLTQPSAMSSTAVATTMPTSMDSESWSPGTAVPPGSPGVDTQGSWDPFESPPWAIDKPPKAWKPYLEEFTVFPKLPIEIRQAIWKFTLQPRAVEVTHNIERGYYSRVAVPAALRVNKDSRTAVGLLYPLCFGSILHQPIIVFNFSLDTLYFDEMLWTEVPKFLVSLKEVELKHIQSIAVDRFIDEVRDWDDMGFNPYDNMKCLKKAVAAMPALQEFFIVVKLDEMWHEHGFPEGNGTVELFEEFPYDLRDHCLNYHLRRFDPGCGCYDKYAFDDVLKDFDVLKKGSLYGWRPTKTE